METILIVDDEKNYLVVLEALLSAEGYEIVTAQGMPKWPSVFYVKPISIWSSRI